MGRAGAGRDELKRLAKNWIFMSGTATWQDGAQEVNRERWLVGGARGRGRGARGWGRGRGKGVWGEEVTIQNPCHKFISTGGIIRM